MFRRGLLRTTLPIALTCVAWGCASSRPLDASQGHSLPVPGETRADVHSRLGVPESYQTGGHAPRWHSPEEWERTDRTRFSRPPWELYLSPFDARVTLGYEFGSAVGCQDCQVRTVEVNLLGRFDLATVMRRFPLVAEMLGADFWVSSAGPWGLPLLGPTYHLKIGSPQHDGLHVYLELGHADEGFVSLDMEIRRFLLIAEDTTEDEDAVYVSGLEISNEDGLRADDE